MTDIKLPTCLKKDKTGHREWAMIDGYYLQGNQSIERQCMGCGRREVWRGPGPRDVPDDDPGWKLKSSSARRLSLSDRQVRALLSHLAEKRRGLSMPAYQENRRIARELATLAGDDDHKWYDSAPGFCAKRGGEDEDDKRRKRIDSRLFRVYGELEKLHKEIGVVIEEIRE